MVTIESFCEHGSGEGTAQPSLDQQRALTKAMRRAAKARHELDAAICRVAAFGNTTSSESDSGEANHEKCRPTGRHQHMPGPHPHHLGPWRAHLRRHDRHHHPTHPMAGRHLRGFGKFPGKMRHKRSQHPHHPPHAHLHPQPHPHPHHHHHHHHHLGHSIGVYGSNCSRGRHVHGFGHRHGAGHGHAYCSKATAFDKFQRFGIGHANGQRGRAHSCPGV